MQHTPGGEAARRRAASAHAPAAGEPSDGLGWLVDYGYSDSLAEAESLRDRVLAHEDDGAARREGRRPGADRWRRWLEIGRPDPDPDAVRDAVLSWHIEALGNQPRHHLVRDLLHASLLRDRRTAAYHRKTTEPEPWVEGRVAHLDHRHRRAAVQHTVLDAMNRRMIGLLWQELEGRLGPPDPGHLARGADFGLLLALWACPPVGALLEWRGDADHVRDFGGGCCRHGRACPWCHARQVRDLQDRLMRGPCRPDRLRGKCLIRIRARVTSCQLQHHPAFTAFAEARGYDVRRAGGHFRTLRFLAGDEVRLAKEFWWGWISGSRNAWGIEGGVMTHQVEPYLDRASPSEEPEHQHELTLVGSFPSDRLGVVTDNGERLGIRFIDMRTSPAYVDVLHGEDNQGLRFLLAGPPYKSFRPEGLLFRSWQDVRSVGDESGALRLMPWFLAGPEQWWSHHEATKGLKLYSAFGTWKETLGRLAGGAERRLAPLRRHNEESRDEALGRRNRLLIAARAVCEDLTSRNGRRPGHKALRDAMCKAGREINERDARWLTSVLKAE